MMAALILLVLGTLFLLAAALKLTRDAGRMHPRSRAWFIVGTIFLVVGGWLALTLRT